MKHYLVMTILGNDRPGLVNSIAELVAEQGGNWLESRMARLAGQFAGIARIECPETAVDSLLKALKNAEQSGINIQVVREITEDQGNRHTVIVEVMGNDRSGILRELTTAIAQAGGNLEELTTGLESAPMSGQPMFRARGVVSLTEGKSIESLRHAIEQLGEDLTVDLNA